MIYEDSHGSENLVAPALQDRSKRSLQRIVTAAELILRRDGFIGFSIADGLPRVKAFFDTVLVILILLVVQAGLGTLVARIGTAV